MGKRRATRSRRATGRMRLRRTRLQGKTETGLRRCERIGAKGRRIALDIRKEDCVYVEGYYEWIAATSLLAQVEGLADQFYGQLHGRVRRGLGCRRLVVLRASSVLSYVLNLCLILHFDDPVVQIFPAPAVAHLLPEPILPCIFRIA